MKVTISGHSDDIILIQGDIFKEYNVLDIDNIKVLVLCPTDHTYVEFHFYINEEGFWKVGQLSPDLAFVECKIFTDDCGDEFLEVSSFIDFEIFCKK